MRFVSLVLLLAALVACGDSKTPAVASRTPAPSATAEATASPTATAAAAAADWNRFGYDARKPAAARRGITPAPLAPLHERRVSLPGTVDASPIYLAGVTVKGARRNVIVMTTTYGRTVALDAASLSTLW